ncbi:MAG: DEAD/DEAH box helicase, partial [Solirubrobacterales bacterium]|nr:DEAD/DEAH box helicase [Solirubrobacterales bacterium]
MLAPLLAYAEEDSQTAALAREGGRAFVSQSLRPYLVAALVDRDPDRPAIVVAGDDRSARDLAAGLRAWLAPRPVRFYPSRGVTYESHLAPTPHLVGLRIAALDALLGSEGPQPVVVVSAVALSEKVPDPAMRPRSFTLRTGELLDLDEVARELVAAGYERVDQVEDRGSFAIRGGLLDVFPATEDRAVRVDLFGDQIESLRWFSTFTQRSLGEAELVEVSPAAELAEEHRELAEIAALEDEADRPDIAELLPVESFHPFLELAPDAAALLIAGEEELTPALSDHWQDVTAAFHDQDAHHLYVAPEAIAGQLDSRARIRLSSIDQDQPFSFRAQSAEFAARGVREAEPELEKLVRSGYRTVVAFARRGEGERLAYNLSRLRVRWIEAADGAGPADLSFVQARLEQGFIAPQFQLAVIPEHRLLRRRRPVSERPGRERRRGVLRSFAELRSGDIVVHEDHGIARFAGFETKTVANVTRDYLYLEYAGSDRVFVPVDQLAKISRYVGAGGAHPPLSKLGGTRWDALKARARRAAQELAGELLNLYAERRRREGYAFAPDSDWQREFEDAFPFAETPDQRDAIEFVKSDMEAPRPMDRLICGDVGYGKTEVALRAAFKAVQDGKQVMLLVPTTILAQQHYGTFSERLKDYPVTIEHVSRFRPAAEQRASVARFAAGQVDILIGTHRLLSRDV